MSGSQQVFAAGPAVSVGEMRPARGHLRGSDLRWAIAFVVPYAAVFLVFVVYPFGYALWMASKPALYRELIADELYLPTLVNTLLFVGLGVNLKMFLALLLSGFFLQRHWWIKALLAAFLVPWAIAAAQACVSFHWMLIGEQGLVDRLLSVLVRHRRSDLVQLSLAWARREHPCLHLEMDAVLDRDLPRRPNDDPARYL